MSGGAPERVVGVVREATHGDLGCLQRLLGLGAVPADVGQSGEENWHVLADPEGNQFCLLRRQLDPL